MDANNFKKNIRYIVTKSYKDNVIKERDRFEINNKGLVTVYNNYSRNILVSCKLHEGNNVIFTITFEQLLKNEIEYEVDISYYKIRNRIIIKELIKNNRIIFNKESV